MAQVDVRCVAWEYPPPAPGRRRSSSVCGLGGRCAVPTRLRRRRRRDTAGPRPSLRSPRSSRSRGSVPPSARCGRSTSSVTPSAGGETAGFDSEHAVLWKDGQLNRPRHPAELGVHGQPRLCGQTISARSSASASRSTPSTSARPAGKGQTMPFPARYSACRRWRINNGGAPSSPSTAGSSSPTASCCLSAACRLPGEHSRRHQRCGAWSLAPSATTRGTSIPYRWARGTLTPLELPPGATSGSANAINARGAIRRHRLHTDGHPRAGYLGGPHRGAARRHVGPLLGSSVGHRRARRGRVQRLRPDHRVRATPSSACAARAERFDPLGIALDINNSGLAVGRHFFEDLQEYHGVLWPKSLTRVPVRLPGRAMP